MSATIMPPTPQPKPEKRARQESETIEDLDESALAKKARKDARVMRNRESAQRSRNQRKNEMVSLQTRVRELEEENRRLRDQTPHLSSSPSTSTSSLRQATPEQRVLSLADNLGIPPSMVSAGVNLSSVAPRHAETELPVLKEEPTIHQLVPSSEIDRLILENRALSERIQTLELLVKQVVAMSNFSTVNVSIPTTTTQQTLAPLPEQTTKNDTFDFSSFVNPTVDETSSLSMNHQSLTTPSWSSADTNSNHPIACHSAAGEGDRFEFASKLDYQGAFKSSGQGHSSLSQNEGMDFGFSLGEARSINETAECKFTNEEEGAVERWEMELKQFLAGIESEPSPFVLDMPANDFYDMRQTVEVDFRG